MKSNRYKILFNNQMFKSNKKWNLEKDCIFIQNKFFESGRSSIFIDKDNFYKLIKTKNFIKSNCRLLTGKSRASGEVFGNHKLRELNLLVPELKYHGTSFLSKHYNEILILEKLNDFITVKSAIKNKKDDSYTKDLLFSVVQQLNLLIRNGVHFRDFHFDNVMVILGRYSCKHGEK